MDMGDSLELSAIHSSIEIAVNKMPHKPAYSLAVISLNSPLGKKLNVH